MPKNESQCFSNVFIESPLFQYYTKVKMFHDKRMIEKL